MLELKNRKTQLALEPLPNFFRRRLSLVAKIYGARLNDVVLSYLVKMLEDLISIEDFARREKKRLEFETITELFCKAVTNRRSFIEKFKRMGDLSLVMCGPFRDRLARYKLTDYYQDMGSNAYQRLAQTHPEMAYAQLAHNFKAHADLLFKSWLFRQTYTANELKRLMVIWQRTQDPVLDRLIKLHCCGINPAASGLFHA